MNVCPILAVVGIVQQLTTYLESITTSHGVSTRKTHSSYLKKNAQEVHSTHFALKDLQPNGTQLSQKNHVKRPDAVSENQRNTLSCNECLLVLEERQTNASNQQVQHSPR
jgi:hypothetical protein